MILAGLGGLARAGRARSARAFKQAVLLQRNGQPRAGLEQRVLRDHPEGVGTNPLVFERDAALGQRGHRLALVDLRHG